MTQNDYSDDNRAVSPVIGVILMVAITVILAAVIGGFVLGLGDSLQSAPQAQLDAGAAGNSDLEISHNGGDAIVAGDLTITVNGGSSTTLDNANAGYGTEDEFAVGETAQTDIGVSDGDRIRVIHTPSESILLDTTIET